MLPKSFNYNLLNDKVFTRLKKVTTMLSPSDKYTNRYTHSIDVKKTAVEINRKIYNVLDIDETLIASCLAHDLGHPCFAHEGEVVFNEFLSKKLTISKEKTGFSHALNSGLFLLLTLKKPLFQSMNLKNKYKDDLKILFDSVIKHSFPKDAGNSIYFNFVNIQYKNFFGYSLNNTPNPIDRIGYLVRVADDISSKNSDLYDLTLHYFNKSYNDFKPRISGFSPLSNLYINLLTNEYIKKPSNFLDELLKSLPFYIAEKDFLVKSYSFDYKATITKHSRYIIETVLEYFYNNPWEMHLINSASFSYIKSRLIRLSQKKNYTRIYDKNDWKVTFSQIKRNFIINPTNKEHYEKFQLFICSLVYQVSTLTDNQLLSICDTINKNNANTIIIDETILQELKNILNIK